MSITVENNAAEALAMAKKLLRLARIKGDQAIVASRARQVRYWTKFIADRNANR